MVGTGVGRARKLYVIGVAGLDRRPCGYSTSNIRPAGVVGRRGRVLCRKWKMRMRVFCR